MLAITPKGEEAEKVELRRRPWPPSCCPCWACEGVPGQCAGEEWPEWDEYDEG